MNLDDAQRTKVADWIAQGLKLSDIQTRLASELGISMTYMDVRLLVDDLKLTPKDVERPKPSASTLTSTATSATPTPPGKGAPPLTKEAKPAAPAGAGSVSVSVDELAIPGAVVSGKVTFTDGNTAAWHLDQMGRLGLAPKDAGYRPPAADLQQFQMALETELAKMGF
jgi:hypothetical protein